MQVPQLSFSEFIQFFCDLNIKKKETTKPKEDEHHALPTTNLDDVCPFYLTHQLSVLNSHPVFWSMEKTFFGPTYLSLANAWVAKLIFYQRVTR